MMLDFVKQPAYNKFIISMHEKYHIPIILTQDCHYCHQEHSHNQRLMLMIQTGRTLQDIKDAELAGDTKDFFELQDANLWLKSEDELNHMWETKYSNIIDYEIFKAAKRKTVEIARLASGVKLDRSIKLPMFPDADEDLKEKVMRGFKWRGLPTRSNYLDRIKKEYRLISSKEFSSYFLIQKMMIDEARRVCPELLGWGDGSEAVGPGRGSAVGSLICYCLGITDVDPIKEDLIFERFLSEARGGKSMKLSFTAKPLQAMADQDYIEEMGYE
jgi:DNA polymerase-3 subunit alpha